MSTIDLMDKMTSSTQTQDFLTIWIGDQIFGIPILQVQDVLGEQKVTKVPLAPPAVAGSLNLRGRIVTAVNVRTCLGLPQIATISNQEMSVVVENEGELYSLMIDKVGDVLNLPESDFEKTPATLDPQWKDISAGIYRLKDRLLVVLDVRELLRQLH